MRKNIYGDEPIKKKQVASTEPADVDYTFNEVEYGLNIDDSIVYLHGDIVIGCLFDFISKVRIILNNRSEDKKSDPVTLMINSNGGDVYEALGIIDYISTLSVPVNVIVRGRAMSAAAMILCCGTGVRAASKSSTIMLHEVSAEIFGKSADIKANAEHIDYIEDEFFKLMSVKTNQNDEFWRKSCRKDFYMNAEKALEFGIIDKII
jgi:ATP-dependent Clp protease protease subunit